MSEHITRDSFFSGAFAREKIDFTKKSIGLLGDKLYLQGEGESSEEAIQLFQTMVLDPLKTNFFRENKDVQNRIYTNLTALNQQLKKQKLPTVDMNILLDIPEELLIMIAKLADNHHLREVCRKMKDVDNALVPHREQYLYQTLGPENVLSLLEDLPKVYSRRSEVQALFRQIWKIAKRLNEGQLPPNPHNHPPLSMERIQEILSFIDEKEDISLIKIVRSFPGGRRLLNDPQFADFNIAEKAALCREFLSYVDLSRITSLDFTNLELEVLPPEIALFTSVTHLVLDRNKLTSLPKEIGLLQNLRSLNLSSNALTSLPDEIGSLRNLNTLTVSNNPLSSLPTTLVNMTSLTTILLDRNRFTSIPDILSYIPNLSQIGLNHNAIASVPLDFLQRTNAYISLTGNRISRFPQEHYDRVSLERNPLEALT